MLVAIKVWDMGEARLDDTKEGAAHAVAAILFNIPGSSIHTYNTGRVEEKWTTKQMNRAYFQSG